MVKITKNEAMWLLANGYKYKDHVNKTHTSHPTYYVTEGRAYNALKKHQNALISYTNGGN